MGTKGSTAPLANGTAVTSSTVAAGMMSLSFLNLVGASPQINLDSGASDRPSYFVEAPTTAQGEGNGDEGQSSQQQQDRRRNQPDQVVIA